MRTEQVDKCRYRKKTDKVESMIIKIVNRYLKDVVKKDEDTVNAIIEEVEQKVKEDLKDLYDLADKIREGKQNE